MSVQNRSIAMAFLVVLGPSMTEPLRSCDIVDNFRADWNPWDCAPFCWAIRKFQDGSPGGIFDATREGIDVWNTTGFDAEINTQRSFSGEITLLLRGTFNGTLGGPNPDGKFSKLGVSVGRGGGRSYYGTVKTNGSLFLGKMVWPGWDLQQQGQLDLAVDLEEELALEIHAGEQPGDPDAWRVELRVWRPDDRMPSLGRPESAQLTLVDRNGPYRTGNVGLTGFVAGGRPVRFYSCTISTTNPPCEPPPEPTVMLRGDSDDDGDVNISDPIHTLLSLFSGGPPSDCLAASDVNNDDAVNITDPTYLLNHLFADGPAPEAPFPDCGPFPTDERKEIRCETPPAGCR